MRYSSEAPIEIEIDTMDVTRLRLIEANLADIHEQ